MSTILPTYDDIIAAAERIAPHAHRTPVLTCRTLDRMTGAKLFFKCENFQRVGAFKFRGATNAVLSLDDADAARGVATHSSGNHGAALALAARIRGIPAHVVVPKTAPAVKKDAMAGYGAHITWCESTLAARETGLTRVLDEIGATFVHPSEDPRVIAGQGTAAVELLDEVESRGEALDTILVPVGGGGLMSGTAIAAGYRAPHVRVIACEPAGADDAHRSFHAGELIAPHDPITVADGLLASLGERTFEAMRRHVADVVLVSEEAIIEAMRLVWQRMKVLIEPSSAVPVAALLQGAVRGQHIGVILSGGNVDLDALPWQVT